MERPLPRSGDWVDTATVSRGRASTITTRRTRNGDHQLATRGDLTWPPVGTFPWPRTGRARMQSSWSTRETFVVSGTMETSSWLSIGGVIGGVCKRSQPGTSRCEIAVSSEPVWHGPRAFVRSLDGGADLVCSPCCDGGGGRHCRSSGRSPSPGPLSPAGARLASWPWPGCASQWALSWSSKGFGPVSSRVHVPAVCSGLVVGKARS
jgi:hypothetical protein